MQPKRIAPEGKVWLCMMCGKTTKDCYGEDRGGWDASCTMNCIAVDEASPEPTEEQVQEFVTERERRLDAAQQRMRDLQKQIEDGAYKPDPELLALAEKYIQQREAGRQ